MVQIFRPRANALFRMVLAGIVLIPVAAAVVGGVVFRSPHVTGEGRVREQPVPFSHRKHVGELGFDCRLCHTESERGATAGMPPTHTCMTCHSQVLTDAAMLAPVRDSERTGVPLRWVRVHDVPDFVYFDHSVHVAAGVACVTCHGPVGDMPLTWRGASLQMEWCIDCHRAPERYLQRLPEQVFDPRANPRPGRSERQSPADVARLTDCYVCHR